MKRLLLLGMAALCAGMFSFCTQASLLRFASERQFDRYCFYVYGDVDLQHVLYTSYERVGDLSIITCDSHNVLKNKLHLGTVSGEAVFYSFKTSKHDELAEILVAFDITIHSKQDLFGRTIVSGYSNTLNVSPLIIDGSPTNIQIAITNNYAIIGTPLIHGSF